MYSDDDQLRQSAKNPLDNTKVSAKISTEREELMSKPVFRVRFHLQRGKHYLHWQISWNHNGKRTSYMYVNPSESNIEMFNCKLVNKKNAAKRVHAAGKKDVCGWVECESVRMIEPDRYSVDNLEQLRYNPIVEPSWRREWDDNTWDWDDHTFDYLATNGNKVYVIEEKSYA